MAKDHKQGKRGLNIIIVGCGKVGAYNDNIQTPVMK